MKSKLLIIGSGGHFRSIIDCLNTEQYLGIAIIDNSFDENVHQKIETEFSIIARDSDAPRLFEEGYKLAVLAVGSVGDPSIRIGLFEKYKNIGFEFPAVIDPSAIISKNTIIDEGVFIGKGTIINTGVELGVCVIVNTGAVIDHDCHLGDYVHIGPNVSLSGGVSIGNCSHIGVGSTIIQSVNIGENTIIGAGSVVIRDIPSNCTAVGVPAIPIKTRDGQ